MPPNLRITVSDLCFGIKEHIGAMGFDVDLDVLPSANDAWALEEKVTSQSLLLTDLRWTQGERLLLKELAVPRTSWQTDRVVAKEKLALSIARDKETLYAAQPTKERPESAPPAERALWDLPDVGFVSTASGPPDLGAPVAPGVGAFFERAGVSHQCLKPHHEEKVEEEPAMFCPKRPEAESKDRYGRCFRCCRRAAVHKSYCA
eukprot:g23361.t1